MHSLRRVSVAGHACRAGASFGERSTSLEPEEEGLKGGTLALRFIRLPKPSWAVPTSKSDRIRARIILARIKLHILKERIFLADLLMDL